MLRALLVTAAVLTVEALVVLHWFWLPASKPLGVLALLAAVVMTLMAAADVALLVGVLRRDPGQPQPRRELEDLAHIEPLWVSMTVLQVAFIAATFGAGVTWLAAVLVAGQGAELVAVAVARLRTHRGDAAPARAA
jgi:uncharacterized protein YhhL (DUF1145 family)